MFCAKRFGSRYAILIVSFYLPILVRIEIAKIIDFVVALVVGAIFWPNFELPLNYLAIFIYLVYWSEEIFDLLNFIILSFFLFLRLIKTFWPCYGDFELLEKLRIFHLDFQLIAHFRIININCLDFLLNLLNHFINLRNGFSNHALWTCYFNITIWNFHLAY